MAFIRNIYRENLSSLLVIQVRHCLVQVLFTQPRRVTIVAVLLLLSHSGLHHPNIKQAVVWRVFL